jgi:hypothetical protein
MADPAIPSALPLPAEDPLPLLRAFSSLTFTKSLVTAIHEGLNHHHEIAGYAGSTPTALAFRLELVVSGEAKVESLQCTVSRWARGELKSLIQQCESCCDPQMLLWAINSYHSLAIKRAKTLAALCWRYPGLLPQFAARGRKRNKGRVYKPENREVVALLGERMLCFYRRSAEKEKSKCGPELVVKWGVGVDDVGEAESNIEGHARFPGACKYNQPSREPSTNGSERDGI